MIRTKLKYICITLFLSHSTTAFSQSADSFLEKGRKMYDSNNFKKATKFYSKAIQLDSSLVAAYVNKGLSELQLGYAKYKEDYFQNAVNDFTKAIELDSINITAYAQRGYAKFELGNLNGAINDYGAVEDMEKALSLDSSLIELHNTIGIIRNNLLGDKFGALNAYTEIIEKGTTSSSPYWNRGNLRFDQEDYKGAIEDFRQVIRMDSINSKGTYFSMQAYVHIGDCLVQLSEYKAAIQEYSNALKLHSNYYLAFYHRGLAKYELNDKNGACSDWKQAKKIAKTELNKYCH